jgi:hypothetical protein
MAFTQVTVVRNQLPVTRFIKCHFDLLFDSNIDFECNPRKPLFVGHFELPKK